MNLDLYTESAIRAARHAGNYLKEHFFKPHILHSKSHINDLVTECDLFSEKLIKTELKSHFPDHHFLCEESGEDQQKGAYQWIVDPLDGTVNFAKKIPFFAVSIALKHLDQIICGVIYSPMTDELFSCSLNQGAYLNGHTITVSSQTHLLEAFGATGFPYKVADNLKNTLVPLTHLLQKGIPLRRLGSAALDLAYVAAGRFDLFFEAHLEPWDYAAGALLIQEAGGQVSSFNGSIPAYNQSSSILATNSHLHPSMLQEVKI